MVLLNLLWGIHFRWGQEYQDFRGFYAINVGGNWKTSVDEYTLDSICLSVYLPVYLHVYLYFLSESHPPLKPASICRPKKKKNDLDSSQTTFQFPLHIFTLGYIPISVYLSICT